MRLNLALRSRDTKGRITKNNYATTCPIRSAHVTWKTLEDESVLLDLETGVYFSLNETETAVWKLFDGMTSLATVGDALCARFNVSAEQVQQDLFELMQTLLKKGWVQIREEPTTPSGIGQP